MTTPTLDAPKLIHIANNDLTFSVADGHGIWIGYWIPAQTAVVQILGNRIEGPGTGTGSGISLTHSCRGQIQYNLVQNVRQALSFGVATANLINGTDTLLSHNVFDTVSVAVGLDANIPIFVLQNIYRNTALRFADMSGTVPNPNIKEAQSVAPGSKVFFDTGAPSSGAWTAGDTVFNSTPAPGAAPGWVYTASGWRAMAALT